MPWPHEIHWHIRKMSAGPMGLLADMEGLKEIRLVSPQAQHNRLAFTTSPWRQSVRDQYALVTGATVTFIDQLGLVDDDWDADPGPWLD